MPTVTGVAGWPCVCATGLGEAAQAIQERADRRQPHLLGRRLDGQRVRQVVDVLGGAEDVDDLAQGRQTRALTQLVGCRLQVFADQVFDGLDIVTGDGLELCQPRNVLDPEITGQRAQVVAFSVRQRRRARQDRVVEQENQPLDLDVHARAVQARLGQVVRQGGAHRAVAAVQRAERFTPARQVRIAVGSGEQCHRVAHASYLPRTGNSSGIGSVARFRGVDNGRHIHRREITARAVHRRRRAGGGRIQRERNVITIA